jgi:hypothetical protein
MSAATESRVREALADRLRVTFESDPCDLRTTEKVDGWVRLTERCWLILEVEEGQHHPSTNVLKLWPFLEKRPELSVILAHVFFATSRAANNSRGELATWLGKRMESSLDGRFQYRRVIADLGDAKWCGLSELTQAVRDARSEDNNAQRIRIDRAKPRSDPFVGRARSGGAVEPPEDIYCGDMPLWSATAARLPFQPRPGGCCVSRRASQAPKPRIRGPLTRAAASACGR